MRELSEFLHHIRHLLQEGDTTRLQEFADFTETDDQYDYENKDIREILDQVQLYIQSGDDINKAKALVLIEEFDMTNM